MSSIVLSECTNLRNSECLLCFRNVNLMMNLKKKTRKSSRFVERRRMTKQMTFVLKSKLYIFVKMI